MKPFLGLMSAYRFARDEAQYRPVSVLVGELWTRATTIEFSTSGIVSYTVNPLPASYKNP